MLALLLADGRTPTGGHAHSGGLEPALADGPLDVPAFIAARLETVARVEATAAALASRARTLDALRALEAELAARTPSAAARETARRLGLALLRTARTLFPDDPLLAAYAGPRPLVLGVAGAAARLSPLDIARLSLYEDAATVAAAAPKLLAVDAADASGWVAAVAPRVEALAAEAAAATELSAATAPLLDLRAERHAHDTRRLFAS
jgi:urease accessory protein